MNKILLIIEHYSNTDFGVSKELHSERRETLTGTGQGNVVLVSTCRHYSCTKLREIEKYNLGVFIKSTLTKDSVKKLAIVFVDDNYFVWDKKMAVTKMTKTLNKFTKMHEATSGRV